VHIKRVTWLALELVDNRCPSQTGGFLRSSGFRLNDVDVLSGRKLLNSDKTLCVQVASKVDEMCQGAPDDNGAEAVAAWLGLAASRPPHVSGERILYLRDRLKNLHSHGAPIAFLSSPCYYFLTDRYTDGQTS